MKVKLAVISLFLHQLAVAIPAAEIVGAPVATPVGLHVQSAVLMIAPPLVR